MYAVVVNAKLLSHEACRCKKMKFGSVILLGMYFYFARFFTWWNLTAWDTGRIQIATCSYL